MLFSESDLFVLPLTAALVGSSFSAPALMEILRASLPMPACVRPAKLLPLPLHLLKGCVPATAPARGILVLPLVMASSVITVRKHAVENPFLHTR